MTKKIVGIVISMLIFATLTSVAATTIKEKQTISNNEWWPMFHKDPMHSGFTTSLAPDTNELFWTFQTENEILSSPAVVDDRVYIGSSDNKTYCINASSGEEEWSYLAGGILSSSPAVASGKVYIGSIDGNMYCLNAETGEEVWIYETEEEIYSSPTISNDRVYFGGYDGYLYCLDGENGDEIWSYDVEESVYGSPAVTNNQVYISALDGDLFCLDAEGNGHGSTELIWRNDTINGLVLSAPTVVSGKLYIGEVGSKFYCFDAEDGEMLWEKELFGAVTSTAAIDDSGRIYIASKYNIVYCLDEDGEEIWTHELDANIWRSSPAIADGKLYIGDRAYEEGRLYCLDIEDGDEIWDYATGNQIVSSPAVADGKVYVGSEDGKVYCFYTPPEPDLDCDGTLTWTEIKPGETVTGEFTVENSGDPESELDWEIESFPDWGEWTFNPESGENLTPEDGSVTIDVEVIAPDEENTDFEGEIKIVNMEDSGDYCTIQVSLSTPVTFESPFMQFLEILLQRVPFLRLLLNLLF